MSETGESVLEEPSEGMAELEMGEGCSEASFVAAESIVCQLQNIDVWCNLQVGDVSS